jgi:cytochrome c oxidase cbb3-type subunit III
MRRRTPGWLLAWLLPSLLAASPLWGQAVPEGEQLYTRNCAACHGSDGRGGVGVPLALEDFLANVPDSYLFATIRHGRPGRVMPAFDRLSDTEVQAIVDYIRDFGPPSPELSTAPVNGDPRRGEALFATHCASCHGAGGEGSPGTGVTFSRPRDLPILAPALNNPGFLKAATDAMIRRTLMQGREGTPMPSLTDLGLEESDIDDIVSFVRSFEDRPPPVTAIRLEADSPVLMYTSSHDFETTLENVKRAAAGMNFRIIREQYLDEGMVEPGRENRQQQMVYFCNFQQVNEALAIDPRVGLFMPCRVTLVERDGVVQVMSINPKYLSPLFNNSYLNQLCDEMYAFYRDILEEATL